MMVLEILTAGMTALKEYIATHVLTCLVPAFLLAGAMVTFINRDGILDYLGEQANKFRSFTFAGISSFLIAACSCTVIPVVSGLYFTGAGIGAAFIVLWVAPAANILALIYTGNILGSEMVVARILAALGMAYAVGFTMSFVFGKEKRDLNLPQKGSASPRAAIVSKKHLILLGFIVLSLLMPNYLITSGPYFYRVLVWFGFTIPVVLYAWKAVEGEKIKEWFRETWWFVKIIFPLLLAGVFIVGIIGKFLLEAWIQEWLGGNGMRQSFLATLIGAVTYFATMTEAPFVDTMMKLGMGKGPALALLLTGPGISLPNWLAVAKVFGIKKALVYIPTIIVLGTLAGFIYGLV